MTAIAIRPATAADLPAILAIQAQCYSAIEPESESAMLAKVLHAPQTCLVAHSIDGGIGAYLLAHPWLAHSAPALNLTLEALPDQPDCLYLHDLAVAPSAQGSGAGTALVQHLLAFFQRSAYPQAALIAIQNASSYWQRFGFEVESAPSPTLQEKLSTYGADAVYMRLLRAP